MKVKFVFLTKEFLDKYSNIENTQIEIKEYRPHMLIKETINNQNLTFAVPLRSNITHKNAFMLYGKSGVDYSKAVVVNPNKDLKKDYPIIRDKEYKKIEKNFYKILGGFRKFIHHYNDEVVVHPDKAENKTTAKFSSLQYFHNELGITHNKTKNNTKQKPIIVFETFNDKNKEANTIEIVLKSNKDKIVKNTINKKGNSKKIDLSELNNEQKEKNRSGPKR